MILSSWHKAFLKLQDLHCGKINHFILEFAASLVAQRDRKEPACDIGDPGLVPGLGRSSGEGKSNPLQYSCLEDPMDRGAWRTIVHGVSKSRTRLSD